MTNSLAVRKNKNKNKVKNAEKVLRHVKTRSDVSRHERVMYTYGNFEPISMSACDMDNKHTLRIRCVYVK